MITGDMCNICVISCLNEVKTEGRWGLLCLAQVSLIPHSLHLLLGLCCCSCFVEMRTNPAPTLWGTRNLEFLDCLQVCTCIINLIFLNIHVWGLRQQPSYLHFSVSMTSSSLMILIECLTYLESLCWPALFTFAVQLDVITPLKWHFVDVTANKRTWLTDLMSVSPSALSEAANMQQLRLRPMGRILQQYSHNAAARLTLQWL